MKKSHSRLFSADRLEATNNKVLIRFKAANLRRIHDCKLEDAKKEYEAMINTRGKNLTRGSS
jgi:hypothetical protein